MEVTPVGLVAVALWFAFAWRGLPWALAYTICLMPFGMAAAINLTAVGNLSLLIFQVCAGLTIMYVLLDKVRSRAPFDFSNAPPQTAILSLLIIYCIFSAIVLPRVFAGDIEVFSLSRVKLGAGTRVGAFPSRLDPLYPGPANISQTAYIILNTTFFFSAYSIMKRNGAALLIVNALIVATLIHGVLALLDATKIPALLAFFRTANYALNSEHILAGVPRIVGGFPEASSFGAASASFLSFFLVHYLTSWSRSSAIAAAIAGVCTIASLSSTAYFACFCLAVYVLCLLVWRAAAGSMTWRQSVGLSIAAYAGAAAIGLLIVLTSAGPTALRVLDDLIFSKGLTLSALERGAWAEYGYRTFFATYGLGAGIGSIRSNGLVPVYLGSVGIVGLGLLLIFLYSVIFPPMSSERISKDEGSRLAIFQAARAALIIDLSARLASTTTPDLGLGAMLFAALLVLARGNLRSGQVKSFVMRSMQKKHA